MSHSKLDELISTVALEARESHPPIGGKDDALRALRSAPASTNAPTRSLKRPILVTALVGALATFALMAAPRPSEAALLLSILKKPQQGIVHEVIYQDGKRVMETFKDGTRTRLLTPEGVEQLFEQNRSWIRYPAGFAVVETKNASTEFMKTPSLEAFLRSDPGARVRKAALASGTIFAVDGELVDGQGIKRSYRAAMELDALGRPVRQTCEMSGLGTSRIEWFYDGKPSNLVLTAVSPDRVYDLSEQRRALRTKLDRAKAGETRVIQAYLDEQGQLGVVCSIPETTFPRNHPIAIDGVRMAPLRLGFNRYVGFEGQVAEQWKTAQAQGQERQLDAIRNEFELDGPVRYGKLHVALFALDASGIKPPFSLQLPLWKGNPAFTAQNPILFDHNQRSAMLVGGPTVRVNEVVRTSSLTSLLCPMNVPFFVDGEAKGATAKPSGR